MTKMLFWMAFLCLWATASIAAPTATDHPTAYALQLSAYARQADAEKAASLLEDKGVDAYVTTNQKGLYVVRAGNHGSRLEAKEEGARLKADHAIGSFLVVAVRAPESDDASAAPTATDHPTTYALQLSAYARQADAEKAASLLEDKGVDAYVTTNQKGLYVVRAGNHDSRLDAKKEGARLKAERAIGNFLVVAVRSSEPAEAVVAPDETVTSETVQGQEDPPTVTETESPDPASVVATAETQTPSAKDKPAEVPAKASAKAQMVAAFEAMANQPMAPHPPGFRAAQIALDYIGVKYRWGGMSVEKGMDCSGFVKTVYALCGINLPRTSAEQYHRGKPVKSDELAVGDMVFFGTKKRVNHVGIYIGDGKIIHAPRSKKTIRISSMQEGYLRKKFMGARRLLLGE